jgi:hypothetical protein
MLITRELPVQTYFGLQCTNLTAYFLVTYSVRALLLAKYVERLMAHNTR